MTHTFQKDGAQITVPYHLRIEYYTPFRKRRYVVERNGDSYTNCRIDGDTLVSTIALSRTYIGTGPLCYTVTIYEPDASYPRGERAVPIPCQSDVLLWRGKTSDGMGAYESAVLMSENALARLSDVIIEQPKVGDYLVYDGSRWINTSKRTSVGNIVDYATQEWVLGLLQKQAVNSLSFTIDSDGYLYICVLDEQTQEVSHQRVKVHNALDATLWDGHQFKHYIDQAIRTTDSVRHRNMEIAENVCFGSEIHSSDFVDEGMLGRGFGVTKDANGNTVVTTDILKVRKSAEFYELIINQMSFSRGATVHSAAGCEITSVEEIDGAYRCYYDNKDGKRYSGFVAGDQARCQRFDAEYNGIVKYYWRVVLATGENYVDLAISGEDENGYPLVDGEGIPEEGDELVQMGNRTDNTRQGVIVIASTPTPTILQYDGINSFVLPAPSTKIAPDDNEFSGRFHIGAGSTGANNLTDLPEVVKEAVGNVDVGTLSVGHNLLRNSGFTGDYRPTEVKAADAITVSKEVYSDALKYWDITNAQVQQSDFSQSGVEVVLTDGSLTQTLKDEIVVGDTYIFSFYAKGESLNFAVAGITQTRNLTDTYERYVLKFKAVKNNPTLQIRNANATICMLQLERGNVPTAWGVSVYDNDKSLAYFQALQYLSSAIKDGSVDILGGLILANMLLLGNYQNGEMQQVTAGVSGVYNDDDDVAFWAGGAMEKAITTVRRFRENPRYQPTDEEWADMANFVATHGGDLFIKGYIFALGGFFRGTVSIANGKILLNEDGSGRLSNGALEWDKEGRLYKNFPDMINWRSLRSSNIDYSKGGYYIAESLSEQSFTLATPPVMPYRVVLKAADAITTDHKNVTLIAQDGARFFYVHPDDPNTFYGGMFMTITTTNNAAKGLIELTRNGATWDVFVPSTMTVGTTGMITDILIF